MDARKTERTKKEREEGRKERKKEEDKSFFDNNFADSGRKKINDNQLKIITKTLNIQQWFHDVCMKGQFDRRLKIIKVENAFRKLEEIS